MSKNLSTPIQIWAKKGWGALGLVRMFVAHSRQTGCGVFALIACSVRDVGRDSCLEQLLRGALCPASRGGVSHSGQAREPSTPYPSSGNVRPKVTARQPERRERVAPCSPNFLAKMSSRAGDLIGNFYGKWGRGRAFYLPMGFVLISCTSCT